MTRAGMGLRGFATSAVVLATGLSAFAFGSATSPAEAQVSEPKRPNVLLVVTDDQRPETIVAMPQTVAAIGDAGTTFSRAFTPVPLCCPARSSIMTGRYIHNHGVHRNGEVGNLDQDSTIQRYLHDAGYRTGIVGKYFIAWPLIDAPPHFDEYTIGATRKYFGSNWNVNGRIRTSVSVYSTEFARRRSLDFLERTEKVNDDQPWFLYAAPTAPHEPTVAEAKYRHAPVPEITLDPSVSEDDRRDKPSWVQSQPLRPRWGHKTGQRQMRTLLSVDDMVGSMVEWLALNDELDNTLIIYTSDNGFQWGEHGTLRKRLPYSGSIAVPMLVSWPGRFEAAGVDDRLVSLVDVAPTILEAAGLSAPVAEPMDGRSLLTTGSNREHVLIEYEGRGNSMSWSSVRSAVMQYTEYYGGDGEIIFREYYDLIVDPYQMENLLGDADPTNDPWNVDLLSAVVAADKICKGSACP